MKRSGPIKRDPEKVRAMERRARARLQQSGGLGKGKAMKRGKGPRPVNPERRRKRYERDFGDYADLIRALPCVINRECWGATEAAHVKSRGAGGDKSDLVPMCSAHHRSQHWLGIETFQEIHKIDLAAEAARLWEEHGDEA